jgi:hypothetical protein
MYLLLNEAASLLGAALSFLTVPVLARSLEEAVTGAEVAAFHSNGVVRRNRVNLLCLSWKSRPSSDCKNDCDCDAAQDTHGRSPLSCSGELALID